MIYLWSVRNIEHIAKHGVNPEDAVHVVDHAAPPYPESLGEGKLAVWGKASNGRQLQVIFVVVRLEDVEADEYEHLELQERIDLEAGEPAVRVIHARDLEPSEKRRMRKRSRG